MKTKKQFLDKEIHLILMVLSAAFVLGAILYYVKYHATYKQINTYKAVAERVHEIPSFLKWQLYSNKQNAFQLRIPKDWQVDEQKDGNIPTGKVTFTPANKNKVIGTIYKLTIMSQSEDKTTSILKTQKIFDELFKHKSQTPTKYGYIKLDNSKINSRSGVLLMESNSDQNGGFILTNWVRKNDQNYFISAYLQGDVQDNSLYSFMYLLSTFRFL